MTVGCGKVLAPNLGNAVQVLLPPSAAMGESFCTLTVHTDRNYGWIRLKETAGLFFLPGTMKNRKYYIVSFLTSQKDKNASMFP